MAEAAVGFALFGMSSLRFIGAAIMVGTHGWLLWQGKGMTWPEVRIHSWLNLVAYGLMVLG